MSSISKMFISAGLCMAVSSVTFAADKAALVQRLHNAAESSSIDDPALKPWHLKLTFQLFDKKGKPTEEGTIEEWWAGPVSKRIYTSPSYNSVEIVGEKGIYRSAGKSAPPYVLGLLRNQVVHPIGTIADDKDVVPELRTEKLGKAKFDCIMLDPNSKTPSQHVGMYPSYCLDPDTDHLRVTLDLDSQGVARDRLGIFQGRSVPLDLSAAFNNVRAAQGHVEALSQTIPDEHLFDLDSSLELQNVVEVSTKDMAKLSVTKTSPIYPEDAKHNHTSGTVIMRARIGTNGHVEKLDLIAAPSDSIGTAALTAARQWTYKPYLVNGVAFSVETTIVVHFNFGFG